MRAHPPCLIVLYRSLGLSCYARRKYLAMIINISVISSSFLAANVLREVSDRSHNRGGYQTDASTEKNYHDRFDNGGQAVNQYRHLFFVKVGYLDQNSIDLAGFFADHQHLGDYRREVGTTAKRLRQLFAVSDFFGGSRQFGFDDLI